MALQKDTTPDSPSIEERYQELFDAGVKAAKEAGWGTPQTHEDLVDALQNMAIPASN